VAIDKLNQAEGVPTLGAEHHKTHDVKKRFVDALFANDWDTVKSLTHPDFELHEPLALPFGGVYKGFEGFRECWALIPQSSHELIHLKTLRTYFSEDPSSIVVELDFKGKQRGSGKIIESKVMEQFEFKDGLCSAIVLYWHNIPPNE
jgi:hypothetical protein